jgi:hypothetical protein
MFARGGKEEEVAWTRFVGPAADLLDAFSREEEDGLPVGMAVGRNLGHAVAVDLQLAHNQPAHAQVDLLHKEGTPGQHGSMLRRESLHGQTEVGFVLNLRGFVLTPGSRGTLISASLLPP